MSFHSCQPLSSIWNIKIILKQFSYLPFLLHLRHRTGWLDIDQTQRNDRWNCGLRIECQDLDCLHSNVSLQWSVELPYYVRTRWQVKSVVDKVKSYPVISHLFWKLLLYSRTTAASSHLDERSVTRPHTSFMTTRRETAVVLPSKLNTPHASYLKTVYPEK